MGSKAISLLMTSYTTKLRDGDEITFVFLNLAKTISFLY